ADGTVWSCGNGGYGQLGNGGTANSPTWVQVSGANHAVQVGAGYRFACYSDGWTQMFCWGSNQYGQLGAGSVGVNYTTPQRAGTPAVQQFSLGAYHSAAITPNGALYTWGYNYYGQLGVGDRTNRSTPTAVGISNPVAQVSGNYYNSVIRARTADGKG